MSLAIASGLGGISYPYARSVAARVDPFGSANFETGFSFDRFGSKARFQARWVTAGFDVCTAPPKRAARDAVLKLRKGETGHVRGTAV